MDRRSFVTSMAVCACCATAARAEGAHWDYDHVADWEKVDATAKVCAIGNEQSPIDLNDTSEAKLDALNLAWKPAAGDIVNNGHTIQINLPAGSSVTYKGRVYELKQYHYHTPSEHAFGGKRSAMEVHFVHASKEGDLLVVGVMMKAGAANPLFAKVMATAPKAEGTAKLEALDIAGYLPKARGLYRYEGSLTTPPCAEVVHWNVFDSEIEVAQADIDAFAKIYKMNARPLQKRGRRLVLHGNV